MKAPIGRRGGKSKIANEIISLFPDPKTWNIFVEPFVGAGNIFYRAPKAEHEIINDKDKDMYIIHKGLQEQADKIDKTIIRKMTNKKFDEIKDKKDPASVIAKYKTSFLARGKYLSKRKDKIKSDFTQYADRLKGVKILNQDFATVIKNYDSKKTFFYLDPPYEPTSDASDYEDYVEPEQVKKALQSIKGKFLLSYNDSPNILKLFKKYNLRRIRTKYVNPLDVKNPIERTELLISNY